MTGNASDGPHIVDFDKLPSKYPTQMLSAEFWEELGRTIATFGFLEEVLGKAIFAMTATRYYAPEEIEEAYKKWVSTLERALSDPLGNLIDVYAKSVRDNPKATIENLDDLISDLREISELRNVLRHGSWRKPDEDQASTPYYFNRKSEKFTTPIDIQFLQKTQQDAAKLAGTIITPPPIWVINFQGHVAQE